MLVTLSIIILCNLNGLFYMIFGVEAPFSYLILFISLAVIYMSVFKLGAKISFIPYIVLLLFFITYFYFGQLALLLDSSALDPEISLKDHYRKYISTIIIITAYFTGYQVILKYKPDFQILRHLAPYFIFTTVFVILSPMIGLSATYEFAKTGFEGERNIGFFGNPNEAGAFANYTLAILLTLLMSSKNKIIYLLLIIGSIYVTITTFSKAAFLAMVLILIFYLLYTFFHFSKTRLKTKLITLFLSFFLFFSVSFIINNLDVLIKNLSWGQTYRVIAVAELLQGKISERSTSERDVLWKHAVSIIPDRIVMGHGLGTFHKLNSGPKRFGVHNTFLMIIGESGILPFLLFILFLFIIIMRLKRVTFVNRYFIICFLLIFILNELMTAHHALGLRYNNVLLGVLILIIFVETRRNKEYTIKKLI